MADSNKKESHAGFYLIMALLAIVIAGGGYWWFTSNSVDSDKVTTAETNLPAHKPKAPDAKPAADANPAVGK